MEFKGMKLCDFCFAPIGEDNVCTKCGLTHENYHAEAGLLMPGANLLGKYIIGRVLGRGGFGATYLAYSSERDRVVAIKEYYPTGIATRAKNEEKISIISDDKRSIFEKGASRFFEEAKTMSRFNTNKNVVSVYEFFYANDTVYYSMEYLEGIDLKGYIAKKGGKLGEIEAIAIMKGVCDALVAVHSTQTLHRDISPDNIFICTNGAVKLIDFGAAKQVIGDAQQAYSIVVKQGFAPPEQYQRNGRQGVWTDIYAVGATMYYALTGLVPMDAMNRVEHPDIEFDPSLNISQYFKEIIVKCLQSKIDDRYQSALELLGALDELDTNNVEIGGNEYVQTIYKGVSSPVLQGNSVSFDKKRKPEEKPVQAVQSEMKATESVEVSEQPTQKKQEVKKEKPAKKNEKVRAQKGATENVKETDKNDMIKKIIIGLCGVAIVILTYMLISNIISLASL